MHGGIESGAGGLPSKGPRGDDHVSAAADGQQLRESLYDGESEGLSERHDSLNLTHVAASAEIRGLVYDFLAW